MALRPDPVEIDASYAGIPEIAAERAGADGRRKFHLSGLRVAAEERQLVCGCGDGFLQMVGPFGAVIRTSRKQNGEQADQERQRRGQKQRQPVPLACLPCAEQLRQKKQRKNAYNEQNGPGRRRRLQNDQAQRQNRQCQNKQIDKAFTAHDRPAAKKRIEGGNQDQNQRCIHTGSICQMNGLNARNRLGVLLCYGGHKRGNALDQLRTQDIKPAARKCSHGQQPDPAFRQQEQRGKEQRRKDARAYQRKAVRRDGKRGHHAEAQPGRQTRGTEQGRKERIF